MKSRNDLVSLHSVERLVHILAPLYERLFCPAVDFLKGSLKSVVVFRRLRSESCEFLVTILCMYCGPKSLRDLTTIIFVSSAISSTMVFHSSFQQRLNWEHHNCCSSQFLRLGFAAFVVG